MLDGGTEQRFVRLGSGRLVDKSIWESVVGDLAVVEDLRTPAVGVEVFGATYRACATTML
jgi:hypothetical protein